jgi:hypothetical protein
VPLGELNEQHNRQIDALVNGFEKNLSNALAHAQAQIAAEMAQRLTIEDGVIADTAENQITLRNLSGVIDAELTRAGYDRIVRGFVNDFPGQLPWFQQILGQLGRDIGEDLKVKFSSKDMKFFVQRQAATETMLDDDIGRAISAAKQKALFSVAGMPLKDLVTQIGSRLQVGVSEATGLADTALPGFYRTIASRGYAQIEAGLKDENHIVYTYFGPIDKFNRPVCNVWMRQAKAGRVWTREQIAKLDNGPRQPKPVFVYCGGYRCRHQWGIGGIQS